MEQWIIDQIEDRAKKRDYYMHLSSKHNVTTLAEEFQTGKTTVLRAIRGGSHLPREVVAIIQKRYEKCEHYKSLAAEHTYEHISKDLGVKPNTIKWYMRRSKKRRDQAPKDQDYLPIMESIKRFSRMQLPCSIHGECGYY